MKICKFNAQKVLCMYMLSILQVFAFLGDQFVNAGSESTTNENNLVNTESTTLEQVDYDRILNIKLQTTRHPTQAPPNAKATFSVLVIVAIVAAVICLVPLCVVIVLKTFCPPEEDLNRKKIQDYEVVHKVDHHAVASNVPHNPYPRQLHMPEHDEFGHAHGHRREDVSRIVAQHDDNYNHKMHPERVRRKSFDDGDEPWDKYQHPKPRLQGK